MFTKINCKHTLHPYYRIIYEKEKLTVHKENAGKNAAFDVRYDLGLTFYRILLLH